MSEVLDLTDADFDEVVLNADKPVLVDFWAEWCGPCRAMTPILDTLATEHGDKITIAKVNADENPDTMRRFKVASMPTLLVFDDGEVVQTLVGAKPRTVLEKALDDYL